MSKWGDTFDKAVREGVRLRKEARRSLSVDEILAESDRTLAREFLRRNKVGRNKPCPCGSGRKFKHCCIKELE